ncbi:hypothetical protein R3P38DRAFT_3421652 [Favolaschia claudopus]|uniref:Uncharacterized protein n=1 Tax=Favolaschia claudopus TaxID=2862362 RepID=A0AAW0D6V7_9AGAR
MALPWSDCFLSISADSVVRSPSVWGSGPALWKIDRAERRRIRESMRDDIVDARDKRNAAMAAEKELEVGAVAPSLGHLTPLAIADGTATEANSESYYDEFDSDGEGPSEDERGGAHEEETEPLDLVELVFFNRLHEKAMTTVRFTHDLSTVTELNDARDYYKEVEAIKRIEQEAAPRIEECRALRIQSEIQRAKETDATMYDEQTIDRLFERPSATGNHIAQELSEGESTAAGSKAWSTASQDKKPIAQVAADATSVSDQEKSTIEATCEPPAQASSPTLILRTRSMLKKSGRCASRILHTLLPCLNDRAFQ